MTIDHSAVVTLMTQEVDPQHSSQSPVAPLVSSDHPHQQEVVKPKSSGSSRRGKQYKCGVCHELGHNQKTCPRRTSVGNEAATIQPALGVDTSELFATVPNNITPSLTVTANGHATSISITRLQPPKLDNALEAANKRVLAADKQVASASTDAEFEQATVALEQAVRNYEKVATCAQRCAAVANLLGVGGWESSPSMEREPKRIRLDASTSAGLSSATVTLGDGNGTGSDAVDGDDVDNVAKDEPLDA